jgi:Leucine-rich repeat (LRR) protein
MHDPGFSKWMREVQSMSAKKQLEAVSANLMELNPGFVGSLVWPPFSDPPRNENGVVVSLQVCTETLSDISPLRSLTGLQSLNGNNGILVDLPPLSGMQLTSLAVAFNPRIKGLSPLRGLPLRSLHLQGTGVTDLSVINTLRLEVLSLRETAATDLTPLKGVSLTLLDCHRTTIANLSPLEGMPLRTFSAPANISRLESVQNLPLTLLEIESHTCTDLSPLRAMSLESLIMILPALSDLKPLTGMKLKVVRVISDRVTEVTPLKGMPATIVELRASSPADLSPLKKWLLNGSRLLFIPMPTSRSFGLSAR